MAGTGRPKTGGRQKGTPNKATADVRAAAQEYGSEALATLALLMRTANSDAAKIAACKEILDRAYGRPQQAVVAEVSSTDAFVEMWTLVSDDRIAVSEGLGRIKDDAEVRESVNFDRS